MSEFARINENGEQEWQIPLVEVYTDTGVLYFSWLNAIRRVFEEPDNIYDHVEYTDENGQKQGTQVSDEVWEELDEKDFPMLYLPVVDSNTRDWYERSQTRNLEQELKDFLSGNAS